jgi:hypothetical protein
MENPYQPPSAPLETEDQSAAIDTLDVSDRWKEKFRIIVRAGPLPGARYANMKALTARERNAIGFNFLAFLFSFIYYAVKGMPRRAMVLLSFGWFYIAIVIAIEAAFDFTSPSVVYWIPLSAVAAALANRDFYETKVNGLTMWPRLNILDSWAACAMLAIAGLGSIAVTVWLIGE